MKSQLREKWQTLREVVRNPTNQDRPINVLRKYLQWNIGRRLIETEYVVKLVDDVEIIISNQENYSTLAYLSRLWDFREMLFLLHLLRPEDLFADVGANVGGYTAIAGRGAGASVVAVEPVPTTFRKLCRNVRLNDLQDRVEAVNVGLADKAGTLRFTEAKGGLNHVASDGAIEVSVQTLDGLFAGRVPRAIKLDVEGFELQVIRGGQQTIISPELCALIVELNGSGARYGHDDDDVHAAIVNFGFEPHSYDPVSRIIMPHPSYNKDGLNTLYLRPDQAFVKGRLAAARKFKVGNATF